MNPSHRPESPSDQELVARCNAGDAVAFKALYRRYRDWVTAKALRFTGEPNDALDGLQETFPYLLRKFPGFRLTASMTTFLYPVVKNTAIRIRRQRRRAGPDQAALADAPADADPNSDGPYGLCTVLGRLPEAQREVVLLRFVHDLSLDQLAAALAIPVGTVKSRLHHALDAIRNDPRARRYFDE